MKLRNLYIIICLLLSMASFYSGQVIAQNIPMPALCKIACDQQVCRIASFTIDNKSCDQGLTYRSQDTAVATIDEQTGIIQPLKIGKTIISASLASTKKCKAVAAACALQVIDASLTVQTDIRDYGESPFDIPYLHDPNDRVIFTSSDPKIITIDGKTATITGVGNAWITVRDESQFREAQLKVTVNSPSVLYPVYLPNARYGELYHSLLTAEWGYAPYTYTLVENSRLPKGLMLTNGVLTGTPIAIGNYTFKVRVTDKNGISTDQKYVLAISPMQERVVSQARHVLSFGENNPTSCTYGQSCQVRARSTSDLPIHYYEDPQSQDNCKVDVKTGIVNYKKAGICTIYAAHDSGHNYLSEVASHTITMHKAASNLFFPPGIKISGEHGDYKTRIQVGGLNGREHHLVKYTSNQPNICKVEHESGRDAGWVSRPGQPGQSTRITATIEEDDYYLKGEASYVCTIHQASQKLNFDTNNPTSCTYGQACQVIAGSSSTSGLPIRYQVDDLTKHNCSVNQSTGEVTYKQAGKCTVEAKQAENENYQSSTASHTITMKRATVQIERMLCQKDTVEAYFRYQGVRPLLLEKIVIQYGAHDSNTWSKAHLGASVSQVSSSMVKAVARRVDKQVDYVAVYDNHDNYYEGVHQVIRCK